MYSQNPALPPGQGGARAASVLPAAVLDQLDHGVAICGPAGVVTYVNRTGTAWAASCGLLLVPNAPVRATLPRESTLLLRLVRGVCQGGTGGVARVSSPAGFAWLAARVRALHEDGNAAHPAPLALITLRRMAPEPNAEPERLMEMFGLSRAEAAILPALMAGKTAQAAAAEVGVSANTVRTHIRAILAKTHMPNLRALAMLLYAAEAA